jgi:hypothetical protein
MAGNTVIYRNKVALNMPRRMGDKLIKANSLASMLTNNPHLPLPWPNNVVPFSQFHTDLQAFTNAEIEVKTGLKEAVAARDSALEVLMGDIRSIMYMVQGVADNNPANAVIIIMSAGFDVKQVKPRHKMLNAAYNTEITGTVMLTADTARGHEWQMTKDEVTIVTLQATENARTYVHNLTPGDVWYFRNRKINSRKTIYNWSPWIKLVIGAGGKNIGLQGGSSKAGGINNL